MRSEEKLLSILEIPHVSEKASSLAEDKQYVFKVHADATKGQVKQAVELLFKVQVEKVNICNVKRKLKRFGRSNQGYRKGWKKAYVALKDGNTISFDSFPVEGT